MVILGQEFAGYTVVASLDSPAPVGAYRALDADGHEVMLYVQEDAALDADVFRAELDRLLSLSPAIHGVVPVIAGGVEGGAAWVAARMSEDPSVEELLPRLRSVAYELVADIARTLSAAHVLGLVHGDLGPHTAVITDRGAAVLKEFGLHRLFGAPADAMAEAACYRAPELFDGRPIDQRTDIYGLGMLLYCVLAGRPPFDGRDDLEVRVLHEMPAPIPGVPTRVNNALARALAKDPNARFQTIQDLVTAVRPLLAAPEPPVAEAPVPIAEAPVEEVALHPVPGPDTERSEPDPAPRDTLPTGTLPPPAVRYPKVRIADPRRRRRLVRAAGALLSVALLALAWTSGVVAVPLRSRLAPPSAPPAPPAGSPVPAHAAAQAAGSPVLAHDVAPAAGSPVLTHDAAPAAAHAAARGAALASPAQCEAPLLVVPAQCDPGAPVVVRPALAPAESPPARVRRAPASLTPPPQPAPPPASVATERHRLGWYGVATY